MSFRITNVTGSNLSVGNVTLAPNESTHVTVISSEVSAAATAGYLLIDGYSAGAFSDQLSALTDSTTGTASSTVADVTVAFDQAILNNNFATLVAAINQLTAQVNNLQALLETPCANS